KGDVLCLHPLGKPMMLIQTHASGKRKVRAYPHEHAAPMAVLNVEVILDDPALGHLEEPTIILLISVGYQNPCGFPRSEHRNHHVVLGALPIREHPTSANGWSPSSCTDLRCPSTDCVSHAGCSGRC